VSEVLKQDAFHCASSEQIVLTQAFRADWSLYQYPYQCLY